jgi:DNA replication protein DnaC
MKIEPKAALDSQLATLQLAYLREHYQALATQAAAKQISHVDYLAELVEGEVHRREQRSLQRRVRAARLPVPKSLDSFDWSWPKKINRAQVQNLFRLAFVVEHLNAVFVSNVGLGKTHLMSALALAACERGYSVRFTTAVEIINTLGAAQRVGSFKRELGKYVRPAVLAIDELGYLPIDKAGGDALFQVISQRYERGSTLVTTNRIFKRWAEIFNNDSTLTTALLDRLLHHCEVVTIEGKSYRMKDKIDEPEEPAATSR